MEARGSAGGRGPRRSSAPSPAPTPTPTCCGRPRPDGGLHSTTSTSTDHGPGLGEGPPPCGRLIERRAAATPGAVLAHEDTGRELTFAGYRDACLRAARAGLFTDYGVDPGHQRELGAADLERVVGAGGGGWPASGRGRTPSSPSTGGREVSFITEQSQAALLVVPTSYRGFDFEAMALRDRRRPGPGLGRAGGRPRPARGEPGRPARGWRRPPATAADAPIRWLFYTPRGQRPTPRARQHTDLTVMASALAMAECLEHRTRRRLRSGLPLHPHRRDRVVDRRPLHRVPAADHRVVRARWPPLPTWPPTR